MADTKAQFVGRSPNRDPSTTGEIEFFKSFLSDPKTIIPINSNFVVKFDSFPSALVNDDLSQFEPSWEYQNKQQSLMDIVTNNPNGICLFANGISLPGESVAATRYGMQNDFADHSGGLLSGMVSTSRVQQQPINVSFLETNYSFVDFVLRPWVTLVSHYGLVARPADQSVKITLTAVFFDTVDNNIRKVFKFNDCAPVSVNVANHAYGSTNVSVVDTTWVYSTYIIKDVES